MNDAQHRALLEFQRQSAFTHDAFTRAIADAHRGFLRIALSSVGPVPRTAPIAGTDESSPLIGRYAIEAVPSPACGLAMAGLFDGRMWIAGGDQKLGGALAAALRTRGVDAIAADELPEGASSAILLHGLVNGDVDAVLARQRDAFCCARTIARARDGRRGVLVTVQDTGGDFGLRGAGRDRAWGGGVAALARTAGREWRDVAVKAIDVETAGRDANALAHVIAGELVAGGADIDVGLRVDGTRVTLRPVRVESAVSSTNDSRPHCQDVILASGGARGVTAACLVRLTRSRGGCFVLLGRSELAAEPPELAACTTDAELKHALLSLATTSGERIAPRELAARASKIVATREVHATLRDLAAAGAQAAYYAVDVTDAKAIAAVCDDVRGRFGAITGIVHGAGVLADRLIADKTDEQFDRVFDTKVLGLRALLDATHRDPLTHLVLFSSVAARFGNAGQADYAMANEIINQVACAEAAQRGASCRVVSIGWGAWDGGMVDASLRAVFERRGVPLIPVATGAARFAAEWMAPHREPVLLVGPDPAAVALDGDAPRERAFDVQVDDAGYSFLRDHTVAGVPVLPLVVVADWFARACATIGAPAPLRLTDLRVLKGVRLDGFPTPRRFTIRVSGDDPLTLSLHGADGTLHYRARVGGESIEPGAAAPSAAAATTWTPARDEYGTRLFHGPRFAVLQATSAVDGGYRARLTGLPSVDWPGEWRIDAAAIDGCLQAARLWTFDRVGLPSLPTHIAAVVIHRPGPLAGDLTATLTGTASSLYSRSDITLCDAAGAVCVELRGVDMHVVTEAR